MRIQSEIDFSRRGEQLRLLDRLQLERGLGVSPSTLVLVLRVIDSFAGESSWCWASLDTLAGRANLNRRTITRALGVLLDEVLLRKQVRIGRRGNRECRYQIVWSNVHAQVEDQTSDNGTEGWTDVMTKGQTISDQGTLHRGARDSSSQPEGRNAHITSNEPKRNHLLIRKQDRHQSEAQNVHNVDVLEEEEMVDLLSENVCRSEAIRLSRKVKWADAETALAEYRHPMNRSTIRGPGALVHRLDYGEWPDASIYTLERIKRQDRERASRIALEAATRASQSAECDRAAKNRERLEATYGSILDSLSDGETHALAQQCLAPFNFERFVRGTDFRAELLEALEKNGS